MLEKRNDEWVPMKMCCPTCGTVNIGYKNKENAVKYECKYCKLVFFKNRKAEGKRSWKSLTQPIPPVLNHYK